MRNLIWGLWRYDVASHVRVRDLIPTLPLDSPLPITFPTRFREVVPFHSFLLRLPLCTFHDFEFLVFELWSVFQKSLRSPDSQSLLYVLIWVFQILVVSCCLSAEFLKIFEWSLEWAWAEKPLLEVLRRHIGTLETRLDGQIPLLTSVSGLVSLFDTDFGVFGLDVLLGPGV